MLTWQKYSEKVDIWSAGCILAELILGRPLFPGKSHIDQFCVITQLLGSPPDNVIANVKSLNTLGFIRSLPRRDRKPLTKMIPNANGKAVLLLERMLQIDPTERCSAGEALEAHYLALYHDAADEPVSTERIDWDFLDADLSADVWKTVMYSEVLSYHESASK